MPRRPVTTHVIRRRVKKILGGRTHVRVSDTYRALGLSLQGRPIGFVRPMLDRRGVLPCSNLDAVRDGAFVTVVGVVTHWRRPGTSKGINFMSLKDELVGQTSSAPTSG